MEYINGKVKSKLEAARGILAMIKCYESIPQEEQYTLGDTDLQELFNDYTFNIIDEIKKSISNGDDPDKISCAGGLC